jgi:hypothetical protein
MNKYEVGAILTTLLRRQSSAGPNLKDREFKESQKIMCSGEMLLQFHFVHQESHFNPSGVPRDALR